MAHSHSARAAEINRAAEAHAAALARAPITDRVNVEPSILNGMSVTEAKVIGAAALVVFVLIGLAVLATTGMWQVLLLGSLIGPTLTLWFGSEFLARLKRGRPDGYYTQALHLWLAGRGLAQPKFITYQGWWSLGRTLEMRIASPFNPPREEFPEK